MIVWCKNTYFSQQFEIIRNCFNLKKYYTFAQLKQIKR
jgi:hypothetical protein